MTHNFFTLKGASSSSRKTSGRRWDRTMKTNQKSVHNMATAISALPGGHNIKHLGLLVFLRKKDVSIQLSESHDFCFSHGLFENARTDINNHFLHAVPPPPVKSFSEYVNEFKGKSLSHRQKTLVINSLSNDSTPTQRHGVLFVQYMSTGTRVDGKDEPVISDYIPTSIRNKVLYSIRLFHYHDVLRHLGLVTSTQSTTKRVVSQSVSRAKKVRSSVPVTVSNMALEQPSTSSTPPTLNESDAGSSMPINEQPSSSFTFHDVPPSDEATPFNRFVQNLISEMGVFQWRIHTMDLDVVAMNDVDLERGTFHRNQFVHVWRWKCAQGDTLYTCQCRMHSVLGASDLGNSCCHIRFMKDFVEPRFNLLFSDAGSNVVNTPLWHKLCSAKQGVNVPVMRLDKDPSSHRFSVLSRDLRSCSIVTLRGHLFSCLNGKCCASSGHSKKLKEINSDSNCEHLKAINEHREQWADCIDESCANDSDANSAEGVAQDQVPVDEVSHSEMFEPFDHNTGLYSFHTLSVSNHKPRKENDPFLYKCRVSRQRWSLDCGQSYEYSPKLDRNKLCKCGQKYFDDKHPDGILTKRYNIPTSVYTDLKVIKVWILDRQCLNNRSDCLIKYSGEQDALHILSSHTAAGDEIGWDFITHATNSTSSLAGYCEIMSKRYPPGVAFMSRQTFTNFIFSWMSSFEIDFRKTCSLCGNNPSVLACDGTNIGIFVQNSPTMPIESPTCEKTVQQNHSRTNRQFFAYPRNANSNIKQAHILAQEDLLFFVSRNCASKPNSETGERSLDERTRHLLAYTPDQCKQMMKLYVTKGYHPHVMDSLHPIMKFLSTCYPLSSLLNYRFIPALSEVLQNLDELNTSSLCIQLPEIFKLLHAAISENQAEHIVTFVRFLVDKIQSTYKDDTEAPQPSAILEPYNPPQQGRAYYFTKHGGRVRDMPKYSCNDSTVTTCHKKYLNSTHGGPRTTFLFLWFCPQHGHCYGCHIVPSSEGRKDPFSSAYLYMETSPSEVFYDFACQLEEYCLNREPHFWQNCRFYHDIFHGFSHKCPFVYSAKRVPALVNAGINSEICEQFNAYIQKIKFSARSMTQSHFMFYLQFFIHHWNEKKRLKLKEVQRSARSFLV